MKITIESTTKIVELRINHDSVPARIWEGKTDTGIEVHAYITRIALSTDYDDSVKAQFASELVTCREPSVPVAAIPLRLII